MTLSMSQFRVSPPQRGAGCKVAGESLRLSDGDGARGAAHTHTHTAGTQDETPCFRLIRVAV